jgi:hypothetical protein
MSIVTNCTDIDFREVEVKETVLRPVTGTQDLLGVPRLASASKQPKEIGFGFVIHLTKEDLAKVKTERLKAFADKGMRMEVSRPIFLRTNRTYYKATFKRGDTLTANEAFAAFKGSSRTVFKNWL